MSALQPITMQTPTSLGKTLNKYTQYLEYSKTCTEMARTSAAAEQRIMLLHIAETWKRLAASAKQDDIVHDLRVQH